MIFPIFGGFGVVNAIIILPNQLTWDSDSMVLDGDPLIFTPFTSEQVTWNNELIVWDNDPLIFIAD